MPLFSKILGTAALGVTLLAGIPATQAQTPATDTGILPTTGTREVGVAGQYVFNGDKPYNVNLTYGSFLSPSLEVGAQAGLAGASGASTATSIGAFGNYYFPLGTGGTDTATNTLLPFIGAFLGYSHNGGSGDVGGSDSTSYGGQAGAKYFFNQNVALDLEYDYRTARHSNGLSYLTLGISTFFH